MLKTLLLRLFLLLHALSDCVRAGTIDPLGQFFALVDPRGEHVIVEGPFGLVPRCLVLHVAIAELFDQVLPIAEIFVLRRLLLSLHVGHLCSLDLSHRLLPGLLDRVGSCFGH